MILRPSGLILARHYADLFGPRAFPLLLDRALRRGLSPRLYKVAQRSLWPRDWVTTERPKKAKPRFFLDDTRRVEDAAWLAMRFPGAIEQKMAAAERICEHVFDFLGTGPVDWGDPIDWHHDVKSGYRWSLKFYVEYGADLKPGNGVDVKIPWELNRLHHFVTLGQAYWLSGWQQYADEFFAQWESWLTANPWPYGVNWTNAMEVAIRAVNLLWATRLFGDAPGWTDKRRATLCRSLWQHGVFIEHNLEASSRNGRIVTANHYLADVTG